MKSRHGLVLNNNMKHIDLLCVGCACYDLVFSVPAHFGEDEKGQADALISMGGGPAANAAVTAAKMGISSAFMGYLGKDVYGDAHLSEFCKYGIVTDYVERGGCPTSLSAILVKPDGKRTVINHGNKLPMSENLLTDRIHSLKSRGVKAILLDGHEPRINNEILDFSKKQGLPSILDAGSVREGTLYAAKRVTYLISSEKFAREITGDENPESAVIKLAEQAPYAVITLGERGLVWRHGLTTGKLSAFAINAVDTTGAGDVFHGAFAAALIKRKPFTDCLVFASAAAALCCTKTGARNGIPELSEVSEFLLKHRL